MNLMNPTAIELPSFDTEKYRLGRLCKRGHDWKGTEQSLRLKASGDCVNCMYERVRQWKKENPLRTREINRRYEQNNKEAIAETDRLYRQNNHEAITERNRRYYQNNREKVAKARRLYKQNNPDVIRKSDRKRKALKVQTSHIPYTLAELASRYEQFDCCCAYCGSECPDTIDHFIPLSKGGVDSVSNYVPACLRCNTSKRDSEAFAWYRKQAFYCSERWQHILRVLGRSLLTDTDANW